MRTEIQIYGEALFGDSWMSQIARNLDGIHGNKITRQAVQNWHRHNKLPQWAKNELLNVVHKRFNELDNLKLSVGLHKMYFINKRIENFMDSNTYYDLTHESIIYCRVLWGADKFGNNIFDAEITLEPHELYGEDGWMKLNFNEKEFKRDFRRVRKHLKEKLTHDKAVHSPELDEPDIHYADSVRITSMFR